MKQRLPLRRLGRASGRCARVAAREDGFSLIEAVASILIVMLFMGASAASLISGYRALRQTKYFQQATALGNRAIEETRDIPFDELGMLNSDLAGDSDILGACAGLAGPGSFYDPGGGAITCERIVSADGNVEITPHIQTATVEGKAFTIRRYVTWVDNDDQGGPGQDYKRMSVVVEWNDSGTTDSFETSTFVARARRGLPSPEFELSGGITKQVAPAETVYFTRTIENLGVTDAYDVEVSAPGGWVVQLYNDFGSLGLYEPGVDTVPTDTNATGIPDTGNVATDGLAHLLIAVTPPAGATAATYDIDLVVTSGANSDIFMSSLDTPETTTPDKATVGPVGLQLYLHNDTTNPINPPSANTNALKNSLMTETPAPTASTLYNYSQSTYSARPGRYIEKNTVSATQSSALYMANWIYQPTATTTFNGSGEIRFHLATKDFACDKALTIQWYLRQRNNTTSDAGTVLNSGSLNVPAPGGAPPCDFQPHSIPFTMTNVVVPNNRYLELKLEVASSSGDAGLFAYDTTLYPSSLFLPLVATP